MPGAFDPSELRAHNETMLLLEKHKDSASFIKIKTLLNPDGSLKPNGTTIQYKEKAFEADE
ncbi:hypothetical protein [Vibrio nigripulchritudo]|uniref:hypothetical protein n=1 Tax=Vibrio nigripulchritudo TaxID=28173 RepID=UPI0003B24189|nr:hypothetical protein [Vibrio nigripulchritudo]CCN69398.1 hypothetical protein VIBNISFn118_1300038 [Vibrio nigripulchritudo SFn118]